MYQLFIDSLNEWNATKTERQKLQGAYLVLIIMMVFVAGIVSLLNTSFTEQVVYVVFVLITAFLANIVAWSLLRTLLLDKLDARTRVAARAASKRAKR